MGRVVLHCTALYLIVLCIILQPPAWELALTLVLSPSCSGLSSSQHYSGTVLGGKQVGPCMPLAAETCLHSCVRCRMHAPRAAAAAGPVQPTHP